MLANSSFDTSLAKRRRERKAKRAAVSLCRRALYANTEWHLRQDELHGIDFKPFPDVRLAGREALNRQTKYFVCRLGRALPSSQWLHSRGNQGSDDSARGFSLNVLQTGKLWPR